jgi:hypothetical protein
MKKLLLVFSAVVLMAAGCNKNNQASFSSPNNQQNGSTQNDTVKANPKSKTEDVAVTDKKYEPGTRKFTSNDLGVTFTYQSKAADNVVITVTEIGNKIYVHGTKEAPTSGQSIEVFDKDSKVSIKQAIEQTFLKGISPQDCFVDIFDPKFNPGHPSSEINAGIGYPDPDPNNDTPAFAEPNKCPDEYEETNGIYYFMTDTNYPDRFFFVSIGQYSITSDGLPVQADGSSYNWTNSLRVIAKSN